MYKLYPYGERDPYASIELIASTFMESTMFKADQMPVLAARVSHANSGKTGEDQEADIKLMNFLAKHKHMTPFEHQHATFKIVLPLFVVREWHRHRTQAYNEVSMRYSENPVGKFFYPNMWREQATRNKQSSAGNLSGTKQLYANDILKEVYDTCLDGYNKLIEIGVCREQARITVPVGNYTEMYATASLRNWFGFCLLRCDETAQKEIRDYADCIATMLEEVYPNSWGALKKGLDND